jgi:hypothetical protein
MNTIGYFEIQSSNLLRDIDFYRKVFGWHFFKETDLPIQYYRIETNSINGGILQRPAQLPSPGFGTNAFVCSVEVANFDTTAALILENGGQVAMPKFAIPGRCYQGYFLDLDNNSFGIFEVNPNAH